MPPFDQRADREKRGFAGMESLLNRKTGSNSYGTDSAALVQTACNGFRLCTLAYSCTEDT